MSSTQQDIDKSKGNGSHDTEYDDCRYSCDGQFDHEENHGAKWHFDVGDHDFGISSCHDDSLSFEGNLN